jgi:N-acetylneuraminic acid mutarotase
MIQRIVVSIAVVFFFVTLSGIANADPAWQAVTPLNVARYQFTGGIVDGEIYVFGGRGTRNLKSTEMYSPESSKWSAKASNQYAVEELTGAVVNEKLYVFGARGGGNPYAALNFVEEYDPVTNTWISKAPKPAPVSGAPAVPYNGEIYLFGGIYDYDSNSGSAIYSDVVEAYDPLTDTWRFVSSMPVVISNMAAAVSGSKVYLIGGIDTNGNNAATDVIAYDFQTNEWITSGLGSLSKPRGFVYSSAAPAVNGEIYLIGGWTADKWTGITESDTIPTEDVQIYNTVTQTFSQGISLPQATDKHLALLLNNSFYVIGGTMGRNSSGADIRTNAVWMLELPCTDNDGDGYKVEGGNCGTADCDDNDPLINPGANDADCNGIDENCSGTADDGYTPVITNCGAGACTATGQLICQNGQEADTCIIGQPTENTETVCNDSIDNDCDGFTDGNDSNCAPLSDLAVTSVSKPPAGRKSGSSFGIKARIKNNGVGAADKAFTLGYYLSKNKDMLINKEADILLTDDIIVSSLLAKASSKGTIRVTIPMDIPVGKYYVKVCADNRLDVAEGNEDNNCRASVGKIKVKK